MEEKVKYPYCGSGRIIERVAIRYEDYDKSYAVYRCLRCGREFSKKDIELSGVNSDKLLIYF